MIVFLPYGLGDTLMAIPALRRLLVVRGYRGFTVVVTSPIHSQIIRDLVDSRIQTYERFNGTHLSQLVLAIRILMSRSKIIIAPLASAAWKTRLFMFAMFKSVYLPASFLKSNCLWLRRTQFLLKDYNGHQADFYVQFFSIAEPLIDISPVRTTELSCNPRYVPIHSNQSTKYQRRLVVGLSCGLQERHKIPSPQWMAYLINEIAQYISIDLYVLGNKDDRYLIKEFRSAVNSQIKIQELIDLPIAKIIGLLSQCDGGISGTTGQGHMMAAAQRPMLILSGVTNPRESGPLVHRAAILRHQLVCGPCYQVDFKWGCGKIQCMEMLDYKEGARLMIRLLDDDNFGTDWRIKEARTQVVPVSVINEIHSTGMYHKLTNSHIGTKNLSVPWGK